MNINSTSTSRHNHHFGLGTRRRGEIPSILVTIITTLIMGVEITAGVAFGSMALLADGVHMGSHAIALGITIIAYIYTRKHANDPRFSFGTGKVNALGGMTGAILLAVFSFIMAWESLQRLFFPISIAFNQAILVAFIGLLVNGISILILGQHGQGNTYSPSNKQGKRHPQHIHGEQEHHHDHNLRSAYLHVLADALTSLFAIFALLSGKYLGWIWLDPAMGIVGAVMVALWSKRLIIDTAHVLLDMEAPEALRTSVVQSLKSENGLSISDLHIWAIGPGIYASEITIITENPKPASHYQRLLPDDSGLVHVTVQVDTPTS